MAQCSVVISNVDQKYTLFPNNDKPQLDLDKAETVMA